MDRHEIHNAHSNMSLYVTHTTKADNMSTQTHIEIQVVVATVTVFPFPRVAAFGHVSHCRK